jgi:hypothetical protein
VAGAVLLLEVQAEYPVMQGDLVVVVLLMRLLELMQEQVVQVLLDKVTMVVHLQLLVLLWLLVVEAERAL